MKLYERTEAVMRWLLNDLESDMSGFTKVELITLQSWLLGINDRIEKELDRREQSNNQQT
jgi:hypothetical protein